MNWNTITGRKVLEISKPRPIQAVEASMDDGIEALSEGRFLRPPKDPKSFWKRVPLVYPAGESQHWGDYTGTKDSMPAGTYSAHLERDIYLPAKFW